MQRKRKAPPPPRGRSDRQRDRMAWLLHDEYAHTRMDFPAPQPSSAEMVIPLRDDDLPPPPTEPLETLLPMVEIPAMGKLQEILNSLQTLPVGEEKKENPYLTSETEAFDEPVLAPPTPMAPRPLSTSKLTCSVCKVDCTDVGPIAAQAVKRTVCGHVRCVRCFLTLTLRQRIQQSHYSNMISIPCGVKHCVGASILGSDQGDLGGWTFPNPFRDANPDVCIQEHAPGYMRPCDCTPSEDGESWSLEQYVCHLLHAQTRGFLNLQGNDEHKRKVCLEDVCKRIKLDSDLRVAVLQWLEPPKSSNDGVSFGISMADNPNRTLPRTQDVRENGLLTAVLCRALRQGAQGAQGAAPL
jgi:hypothetical protein